MAFIRQLKHTKERNHPNLRIRHTHSLSYFIRYSLLITFTEQTDSTCRCAAIYVRDNTVYILSIVMQ